MGEFTLRLKQRIHDTELALCRAESAQDAYAVQVEQGELDSLLRIAHEHNVDLGTPVAA